MQLQEEPDTDTCALEKKWKFTTASLYRELTFPGVENKEVMSIWRVRIPMKIKFFLWSIYSDCLPSAEQLVRRNWPGVEHCKLCGQIETTQHIFFECYIANYCWWTYHVALFWTQTPINLHQFLNLRSGRWDVPKSRMIFLFACICWSLWLIRNDYVFNNKIITSLNVVVRRSIFFLQNGAFKEAGFRRKWKSYQDIWCKTSKTNNGVEFQNGLLREDVIFC